MAEPRGPLVRHETHLEAELLGHDLNGQLEGRAEVVLKEPEFDGLRAALDHRQHHDLKEPLVQMAGRQGEHVHGLTGLVVTVDRDGIRVRASARSRSKHLREDASVAAHLGLRSIIGLLLLHLNLVQQLQVLLASLLASAHLLRVVVEGGHHHRQVADRDELLRIVLGTLGKLVQIFALAVGEPQVPHAGVRGHLKVAQVLHDERVGMHALDPPSPNELELEAVGRLAILDVVTLARDQQRFERVLDVREGGAVHVAARHVVAAQVVDVLNRADGLDVPGLRHIHPHGQDVVAWQR